MQKQDIPNLIKRLRKELGLTQVQFARRIGVTFASVNSWENGRRTPSPLAIKRIQGLMEELGLTEEGLAKTKEIKGAVYKGLTEKKSLWQRVRKRFFTPRWILVGVTAAVVLIGFVISSLFVPSQNCVLEGTLCVEVAGEGLKVFKSKDSLPIGQTLKTPPGQSAKIRLRDSSIIKMFPNTILTLKNDSRLNDRLLELEEGKLKCQVARGKGFRILMPGAELKTLGTEFTVRMSVNRKEITTFSHKPLSFVDSATVRVDVSSGSVALTIEKGGEILQQQIKAGERVIQEVIPQPSAELKNEIKRLIKNLEDEKREIREKAIEALTQIGLLSIPFLEKISSYRNPEIKSQVKQLLDRFNPPSLLWTSQIVPYRIGLYAPVISNNQLYLTASEGPMLYAIDCLKGTINWNLKKDSFNSAPLVINGTIYIGTMGGSFFVIESKERKIIWEQRRLGVVQSTPTILNDTIYIGSGEPNTNRGIFYALDAHSGRIKWIFPTQGIIAGSQAALFNDELVLFGAWDHKLYALNLRTGELVWDYQTGGRIATSPLVDEDNELVYFGSWDGKLYVLSVRTGEKQWVFQADSAIIESPVKVGTTIYWGTKHKIYALDLKTRTVSWTYNRARSTIGTITVVEGIVYLGTDGGKVIALNATTGEKEWDFEILRSEVPYNLAYYEVAGSPAIFNNVLYIASRSVGSGSYVTGDRVYALKLRRR